MPSAWGRKPLQKPVEEVVADIRRRRARRAIFIDLNLIADKQYATELFEALIPLQIHWYGLATTLLCQDEPLLDLVARSGCRGLLMGLESLSRRNLGDNQKPFNNPEDFRQVVEQLHARKISLQGCFVFGLDDDTPDVFLETAKFAVEAGIDLPRFAIVTPFPGTSLYKQTGKRRPDPDKELGAVRRATCRLSAGGNERRSSCNRATRWPGNTRTAGAASPAA